MNKLFSLRFQLATLAVALLLIFGVAGASGQTQCIGQCLTQLNACQNSPDPPLNCDDAYNACVEHCLGQR